MTAVNQNANQFLSRSWPRRWLQFSLRGLLIFLLVMFAGLGYYADQVHRQRAATAAIRRLGGQPLVRSSNHPSALKERLSHWLGPHAVYTVRDVYLGGCTFSDDDLACLAGLPHLRTLTLTSTPVTDDGLAYLRRLKRLTFVDLRFTHVTSEGVEYLRRCLPHAKVVYRSDID